MTKEELDEINISQMSTNDRQNLFKKLDLEQKKENFLRFFEIDGNSSLFEQFPVEDRLEQYMKFIDAYFVDAYYINHLQGFIQCYEMLSETEKINMAEITTLLILNNLGKNIEMLSEDEYKDVKINGLLNVVKNLSEENQKKYAKNVFEYCSDSMENISEFLLTFNKDSHSLVAFDVIDKLERLKGRFRGLFGLIGRIKNQCYKNQEELVDVISKIDFICRNKVFLDIFNIDMNKTSTNRQIQNINFITIILENSEELRNSFIEYLTENDITLFEPEQLKFFKEYRTTSHSFMKRHEAEFDKYIGNLYIEIESSRLVKKYSGNNDKEEYISKELYASILNKMSENLKNNDFTILEQEQVYLSVFKKLFDELKPQDKEEMFSVTLKEILDFATSIKAHCFQDEKLQEDLIIDIFGSIDNKEKKFNNLFEAFDKLLQIHPVYYGIDEMSNLFNKTCKKLNFEERKKLFSQLVDKIYVDKKYDSNIISAVYTSLKYDDMANIFKDLINQDKLLAIADIMDGCSLSILFELYKIGKITLDNEIISKIMSLKEDITVKTLIFDKDTDRDKLFELSFYEQLNTIENGATAININSVIENLFLQMEGKSKEEFNKQLDKIYNLFTYNNVPQFIKNLRMFQLGEFYSKENGAIASFQGKTKQERDSIILEDLFKISLDSNNKSLREFANILIEGKELTVRLQSNPEEEIKLLTKEERAILEQYRDTLFDLHNITRDIRDTNRQTVEKTDDVIKDLRTLNSIYSDKNEHDSNSENIVFNPNLIIDELFDGFITTTIKPEMILEYMDKVKTDSDERHLEIEKQLRAGTLRLEEGDFVKGIVNFEEYLPSMLRDGIKGGEFNQEHSHSDMTPLDTDFSYVSKKNLEGMTLDYSIIKTTASDNFGNNWAVLKKYEDRLKDRTTEIFGEGTFTGSPDYYGYDDLNGKSTRYVRTGIPITDVDYIVSDYWSSKYGYEMAMAGIYIPVINKEGNIIFSSDEYNKIREEMRGLSYYGADDLEISNKVENIELLFEVYKSISSKTEEEIEKEIDVVREMINGKTDNVTIEKKNATTKFIKDFFESRGIKVTINLSENLSSDSVELIDTGSTGRGTNIPGDGDFDFMLRHSFTDKKNIEELYSAIAELKHKKYTSAFDGIRTKKVVLPTGEEVDIDITTAKKSLKLIYSSDMCVRDRLQNIREKNPEKYNYVIANIIMAKRILKEKGIYKKGGSDGATEYGGFGGIGVENWILQNEGSFEQAIETFVEVSNQTKGDYYEFRKKYPIFDFGFNHREKKVRHDCYSNFFGKNESNAEAGYKYARKTLEEIR